MGHINILHNNKEPSFTNSSLALHDQTTIIQQDEVTPSFENTNRVASNGMYS